MFESMDARLRDLFPARRDPSGTRQRKLGSGLLVGVLVCGLLPVTPARAEATVTHLSSQTEKLDKDGGRLNARAWPYARQQREAPPAPEWPAAGTAHVSLTGDVVTRAGSLPVSVTPATGAAGARVSEMTVQVLDRTTTPAAWQDGMLMRVGTPTGSQTTGTASLSVDYRSFRYAYGGDWASRLRLWQVPECALRTPAPSDCMATPLRSRNDTAAGVVTAEVPVVPLALAGRSTRSGQAAEPASAAQRGTLVALVAGPSGPDGTFTVSPLAASSTWGVGGATGGFTWSYGMRTPPVAGPAPGVSVSYSSASVDGRSETSNTQPSWVGEGFDYWPGYVERRYVPCAEDMDDDKNGAAPNNTVKNGDLCWRSDNAVMNLGGHGSELVYEGGKGWHSRSEDGSKIEKLTGAGNDDNNGEYWKVTTTDGTQYFFGRHSLPGQSVVTESTWTVPVAGNHINEPCNASSYISSFCDQAWRWNLDYVVDPRGNTTSYWYAKETNKYGRNISDTNVVSYTRGGTLARIDYGTWDRGADRSVKAIGQVLFDVKDRCFTTSCGTHNATNWPDTPWDQECTASPCTHKYAPTFWTTKRLAKVTTRVWDTTKTTPDWQDIDSWTFTHSFPPIGDGSDHPGLWLDKIDHAGLVGGTVNMPPVTFTPVSMPNRVLTDNTSTNNWQRLDYIITETGAKIDVAYSLPECTSANISTNLADAATNTKRCYPVLVIDPDDPAGERVIPHWWHKYVVTELAEADVQLTSGHQAPPKYTYYEYVGTPAWHYADDDGLSEPKYKTWNQFRGYTTVKMRTGDVPGAQTLTETRYLRGMHGDRLAVSGGTRTVTVPASLGTETVNDEDQFAGMVREQITYDGTTSKPVSKTVNVPWMSAATASRTINGDQVTARYTNTRVNYHATALGVDGADGWRTTRTESWFNGTYGTLDKTQDSGDLDKTGDESCTTYTYNRNTGLNVVGTVKQTTTTALPCGTTPTTTEHVISDSRNYYDGAASADTAPTYGTVTKMETLKDWSPTSGTVWQTAGQASFDAFGRQVSATDLKGNVSTTEFTPASGGPVTKVTTKRGTPFNWTSSVDTSPYWGTPTKTTDLNGVVSEASYDALGRVHRVWGPGWSRTGHETSPSAEYTYSFAANRNAYPYTTSKNMNAAGGYKVTYQIYDALFRPRQSQTPSNVGGATVVADTLYDKLGRAATVYQPHVEPGNASGQLWWEPEWSVPAMTKTVYDNASRTTAQIFLSGDGVTNLDEQWRITTAYEGNLTKVTPPAGSTPTTTLDDAQGRVVELREHTTTQGVAGAYLATKYAYNGKGQLTQITDTAGDRWTYKYDVKGRQWQSTDPDKGTSTSEYNDANEVQKTTDGRGEVLWHSYDTLGRKTELRDDSSTGPLRAMWKYDKLYTTSTLRAKGQLTEAYRYDTVGATTSIYKWQAGTLNERYQPMSVNYVIPAAEGTGLARTWTMGYDYSPYDGSPTTVTYPTGGGLLGETVTTVYDATTGLPTKLQSSTTGVTNYVAAQQYTEFGEPTITTRKMAGGAYVEDTAWYDEATRQLKRTEIKPETATGIVSNLKYFYDKSGNVTSVTDTPQVGPADTQCFTPDPLGRLATAWTPKAGVACGTDPTVPNLGGPAPYWLDWTYDDLGSRKKETSHAAAGDTIRDYTYPTPGQDVVRPHAVTKVKTTLPGGSQVTTNYGYDAAGNMACRPNGAAANACPPDTASQNLTWDAEGRLVSVSGSGAAAGSNIYDADGARLLRRDATGTTLFLPGQEIRQDTTGATSGTRYYSFGGKLIASRNSSGVTWLFTDRQGTQHTSVNASTQAVTTRRQTPFGSPRGTDPVWANPRGFVGGDKDPNGLTHLGARDYDPGLGRFISVDPLQDLADPQQWNGYAYAHNSPVTSSDPSGLIDGECARRDLDCSAYQVGNEAANQHHADNPCWPLKKCPPPGAGPPKNVVQPTINDRLGKRVPGGIPDYVLASGRYHGTGLFTYQEAFQWAAQDPSYSSYLCYHILNLSESTCDGFYEKIAPAPPGGLKAVVQVLVIVAVLGCALAGPECIGPAAAGIGEFAAGGSLLGAPGIGAVTGYGLTAGGAAYAFGGTEEGAAARMAGSACSFSADTQVLMADGSAIPIKDIKVGDHVAAADPQTGEEGSRPVTNLWIHEDRLSVLLVNGNVLTTTEDHPFWNVTDQKWERADELDPGDGLATPSGSSVAVSRFVLGATRAGMAYNLTVNGIHTYYVLAGTTPVLVHNTGPGCGSLWMNPGKLPHHYMRTSDEGVMHAADFGVSGPYNKANGQAFIGAVERFTKSPGTIQVRGSFRGQDAIHYVDPDTGLHASFAANGPSVGEYLGGWKSGGDQLTYLLQQGKL
ncbi:polymorphic toxin-type HINT domain-containing protein [Micromonospora rifamycinica]|uniref:polymorphic toxin-type HINT domain-containing protein n=1 Tax=Micromonospora rifamycinica TaxID=291594 RepID=UPI000A009D43|nr:polymorphic toxin-type HINT domain-containing protein [Micromonospora rifamycinica]